MSDCNCLPSTYLFFMSLSPWPLWYLLSSVTSALISVNVLIFSVSSAGFCLGFSYKRPYHELLKGQYRVLIFLV